MGPRALAVILTFASLTGCAAATEEEDLEASTADLSGGSEDKEKDITLTYAYAPVELKERAADKALFFTLEAKVAAEDFRTSQTLARPSYASDPNARIAPADGKYSVSLLAPASGSCPVPSFSLSKLSGVMVMVAVAPSNTTCIAYYRKLAAEGSTWKISDRVLVGPGRSASQDIEVRLTPR
jgi:hypothetical protein